MRKFKRVLVANRGEIAIRVFRACRELGIRTVAIYSEEDKTALFRTKADESYQIGKNKGPVEAYLDIEEIINLALKKGVDAIHPGYGFLSENAEFVRKCEEVGIEFIGPTADVIEKMGDKINSKIIADSVDVPTIPGSKEAITSEEKALAYVREIGCPVMLKAAAGGGGRGMRIVRDEEKLIEEFRSARNEAKKAFGIEDIFIEKYLEAPKHIEVQILGDSRGNIYHLYERDCSIQRRHQKLIEFTPAIALNDEKRAEIAEDALKISRAVNYRSAGTVEFLVDKNGDHYFIEMNPRIQVEHTVTEMVTGIDIVQSQILVAQGHTLDCPDIGINSQDDIEVHGCSIQCRVTTEDPSNNFVPDTGLLEQYRTSSGFGIRLDGGNGYTGSTISPYFDSLLVKIISWSRTFEDSIRKVIRSIEELKIKGVKTNVDFLINVLNHETFKKGECDTGFIASNPELVDTSPGIDLEQKIMKFLGEKIVNVTKGQKEDFDVPLVPRVEAPAGLSGTRQILEEKGAEGVMSWVKDNNKLLLTDTTYRDAHQSLMATRMRTIDMLKIANSTSVLARDLFSLEMWGGATFDVSYRFLKESPWERLEKLRKEIPNILFQMLLRGANGVGYKNYPDNVIRDFIKQASESGIDVFRIFDSLNWLKGMEIAIEEVIKNGKIAEACICYTGDILDTSRKKYNLQYYIDKARELESTGIHILGIKDMAGLLKPYAAYQLIQALKSEISIPIHLHTHDTSGNGVATLLMAAEAGVDIVDTAIDTMSGLTSQPSLNSVVAALENTERDTGIELTSIQEISDYWGTVRPVYEEYESDLKSVTAEIYKYEIPGGQYSNLRPQVESLGLGHRFKEIKAMYKKVNNMLGDIIKVTPSSKVVGDMSIFMVQNNLTAENIYTEGKDKTFPDSVVSFFKGMIGQPLGGFPERLQKLVLKGEKPITVRPGELMDQEDFDKISQYLKENYKIEPDKKDLLSYALYPKVFEDYLKYQEEYGNLSRMGSDIFFHGLYEGEICQIELSEGKTIVVKLLEIRDIDEQGNRKVVFEINGFRRSINIHDEGSIIADDSKITQMADPTNNL
ncbi:MAG: pyruvate carboxylase, partial [Halanaerobiales bacterium]